MNNVDNNVDINAEIVIDEYNKTNAEQGHQVVLLKALVRQLQTENEKLKDNIQKLESQLSPCEDYEKAQPE